MLPLVLAAIMLAMTAIDVGYNVYSTNQSTKMSDEYNKYVSGFYGGQVKENSDYFNRYIKAHHINPSDIRFPYRTGMIMSDAPFMSSDMALYNNQLARYGSYVHGGTSIGRAGAMGYGVGQAGYRVPKNNFKTAPNSFYA